jgi:hypothetical protein
MSKTSATRRASNGALNLYPADTTLGWRVIGLTTALRAAEKLARNEWREVYDEHGTHLGYQVIANFKTDQDLSSNPSSCAVTVRESELYAGQCFRRGKSSTMGMPEDKRLSRPKGPNGRIPSPEDAVERAVEKVKEWGRWRIRALPFVDIKRREAAKS